MENGRIVIESVDKMIELAKVLPPQFKFQVNMSQMRNVATKQGQTFFNEEMETEEIDLRGRVIDTPKIKNIYLVMLPL